MPKRFIREADPIADRKYRQEGIRLWNQIIRRVRNEIKADPNEKSKPKLSQVSPRLFRYDLISSNISNLGYCDFANIGSLVNSKKYSSLTIGFATKQQGGSIGAGAWFSPRQDKWGNDEIVVFGLDLALLGKASWLDQEVFADTNVASSKWAQAFVHEFVHYMDSKRYKDPKYTQKGTIAKMQKSASDYFNDPKEFNAHSQDILAAIDKFYTTHYLMWARKAERVLRTNPTEIDPSYLENAISSLSLYIEKPQNGFQSVWQHIESAKLDFIKNLTPENKKKFQQRVYQFYREVLVPKFKIALNSMNKTVDKLKQQPKKTVLSRFKDFFKDETIKEVHYQDYYHKNFELFRKKYLRLSKENNLDDYYVNYTNHTGDKIDKSMNAKPDHGDPVGIYGYPLSYVLKYPADVWYGANAKYLRILEHKKKDKTLYLQSMNENNVIRLLAKIYHVGWSEAEEIYETTRKWLKKWGRSNIVQPGTIFFFNVQHDLSAAPEYDEKGWTPKKGIYPNRSQIDQSKILLNLGFLSIIDDAKNNKRAIINDREPEQIIFLRRDAFDIIETITMNQRSDYVRTTTDPTTVERKLVSDIANVMGGDKIISGPERSGLGGWSYYWTKSGRRIEVDFSWSKEWFDHMQATRKMGEKKHREHKLHDMKQTAIQVQTEYGPIAWTWEPDVKFKDIVKDFQLDWADAKKKEKDPKWEPETLSSFKKKMEDERTLHWIKNWIQKFSTDAPEDNPNATTYDEYIQFLKDKYPQFLDKIEAWSKEFEPVKEETEPDLAIVEDDIVFRTGKPVTLPYIRNTEKSPQMGQRFQQDIEPYGTYMLLDSNPDEDPLPGWIKGTVTFKKPLVIPWNTNPNGGYDETSWKALLANKYNKKGAALTQALKKDGYDAIVTVDVKRKITSEIIKLP